MHDPNYVKIATGLFIMLNPFVLIPVFLGLTGGMSKAQRMKIAMSTSIAVFIIMIIAVFAGNHVLPFLVSQSVISVSPAVFLYCLWP